MRLCEKIFTHKVFLYLRSECPKTSFQKQNLILTSFQIVYKGQVLYNMLLIIIVKIPGFQMAFLNSNICILSIVEPFHKAQLNPSRACAPSLLVIFILTQCIPPHHELRSTPRSLKHVLLIKEIFNFSFDFPIHTLPI